ncbi:hypothetical protein Q0F98_29445 [Paenibacillus amylolyticus]|nr:hypothetical protein Q0F98_29445 [Paenibacillus amylolyticus]
MKEIYTENSIKMPAVVVLVDFNTEGKANAIPLPFEEIINVAESRLSFLEYMKRKNHLK